MSKYNKLLLQVDYFYKVARTEAQLDKIDYQNDPLTTFVKSLTISDIENGLSNFESIINFLGCVPTPFGNPLSVTAGILEFEKGNIFSGLSYLLTAAPFVGILGTGAKVTVAVANTAANSNIFLRALGALNKMPSSIRKSVLTWCWHYFQSETWKQAFNYCVFKLMLHLSGIQESIDKKIESGEKMLAKIANSIGATVSNNAEATAKDISNTLTKMAEDVLKTVQNQIEVQLNALTN